MLLPSVIILAAVTLYPFLFSARVSLLSWNLTEPGAGIHSVGLGNFARAFGDPRFLSSVRTTAVFTVGAVALEFLVGLGLALLLNRPGRLVRVVRTALLLPVMVTPVVIGLVFLLLYNERFGILNYFLTLLGGAKHAWLADPHTALPALILADVWQWSPFIMLVLLAGLHALPGEIHEAARVDGAGFLSELRHITLPLLKWVIIVGLLIRTADAIKMFDLVYATTRGGPGVATETTSMYVYVQAFDIFEMGYGAALGLVMVAFVTVIAQFFIRMLPAEEEVWGR